jgi:nicotinate dehydrogenase subunit A
MKKTLELGVNGSQHLVSADPEASLLSVLRDELGLTGSKYGCGEGQCGACTVMINGVARRSCITKAASVGSKPITTIEGLDKDGGLHPLQQAFLEVGAMQCGYCTSGMIVAGAALLATKHDYSEDEIIRAMQGNICRCGTYPRIVAAIRQAALAMKEAAR